MLLNPLTSPTSSRPVFVRASSGDIEVFPSSFTTDINIHYIERPQDPVWGYVVVSGKALYNSNASTNFDLHQSEENNLVMRILMLAGISMKDQILTSLAAQDAVATENKKNN
jgi:predicted alpha/beta hydrolase family esterase